MIICSLLVLAAVNFVGAVSYLSIVPTLIFYIQSVGGTKEQYGLIMSAFAFASFVGNFVFGVWVDKSGNKFRIPYVASFLLSIAGGLIYFYASVFGSSSGSELSTSSSNDTTMALAMILAGRILGGLGAGNAALGYAYLATLVPYDQQTRINSLLAISRIIGMALGPAVNVVLGNIDTDIQFFGSTIHLNALNSVGLLLALLNGVVLVVLFVFLQEPPKKAKSDILDAVADHCDQGLSLREKKNIWNAVCCIEIMLPIIIIFIVNSSFQLIETAFAPAVADGLGWGPVETSGIMGTFALVIFFVMITIITISKYLSDITMVAIGACLWVLGGTGIYFGWARGSTAKHFVLPVFVAVSGFPFVAASDRSLFSKSIASKPELENVQASMQAVLSMATSVAGFVTPDFVAAYVIRTPEEIDAADDNRELTPWALYSPVLSASILVGLFFLWRKEVSEGIVDDWAEDTVLTERTSLVRDTSTSSHISMRSVDPNVAIHSEVHRRCSVEIMGLSTPDTFGEAVYWKSSLGDLDELEPYEDTEIEIENRNLLQRLEAKIF